MSRYEQSLVTSKSKYPLVFSPHRDSRDVGRDVMWDLIRGYIDDVKLGRWDYKNCVC